MPDQDVHSECCLLPWPEKPPTFKITTVGLLYAGLGTCPHAQTLEAYSPQFGCTVWIALPCKQWSCRFCAEQKIKRLSIKTEAAKPNRLLTLTVDPSLWENPRAAFDGTRRKVPECMRHLRTRFTSVEYLRVTELTRRGWPHYHLMVRSPYIPHAVVKSLWTKLTGALIVDLRQIDKKLNCYNYLVKYLSKMHKIGWTERHVSYSRNFFPIEDFPNRQSLQLDEKTIIESHPSTYLYARFRGATLTILGANLYALNPTADSIDRVATHDDWENCAESPSRDQLFPTNTPKEQTPHPTLFENPPESPPH